MQKRGKHLASPLSTHPYSNLKSELLMLAAFFVNQRYTTISRDVELGNLTFEALIPNWPADDSSFRQVWLEKNYPQPSNQPSGRVLILHHEEVSGCH